MKLLEHLKVASAGIASGKAVYYRPLRLKADTARIKPDQTEEELARYKAAEEQAKREIAELAERSKIFQVHRDLVEDPALHDRVVKKISEEYKNAELALEESAAEIREMFQALEDKFFRERAVDVMDVCGRILSVLKGAEANPLLNRKESTVLLADELTPSDTASMDLRYVRGFITRYGGENSHVAIMARSMELPALVGIGGEIDKISPGDEIILDALEGEVIVRPDKTEAERYAGKAQKHALQKTLLEKNSRLPAITKDGRKVCLCANAGSLQDIQNAVKNGAEGVGLLRTEFLYLENSHFPTEEEQVSFYQSAAKSCPGDLIIRTLDIGGDKILPYFSFEKEDNPFLGWRAIRFTLERQDLFRTQLRAILRSSPFGKLKIMFPMIISPEELESANRLLEACKEELRREKVPFDEKIPTGIMVETPAAVACAEDLARRADFFSIGTNDLTQYLLAVDRGNKKISHLYDSFHPAVLRSIRKVIEAGRQNRIPVGMCGEFAGNEEAVPLLLGMGLNEFSMAPSRIPWVKNQIRKIREEDARAYAEAACRCRSVTEVRNLLGKRKEMFHVSDNFENDIS